MRKGIGASDTFSLFIAPQDLRCGVIDKLEFDLLCLSIAIIKFVIRHTFYFHVKNFFDKRGAGYFRR